MEAEDRRQHRAVATDGRDAKASGRPQPSEEVSHLRQRRARRNGHENGTKIGRQTSGAGKRRANEECYTTAEENPAALVNLRRVSRHEAVACGDPGSGAESEAGAGGLDDLEG